MKTQTKLTLLDGKLHLFKRERSPFWWCGFYHHQRFIRATTKLDDTEAAKKFATQWFYEKQVELKNGTLTVNAVMRPASYEKSFAAAAEKAIDSYKREVARGDRSESYAVIQEKLLRNRILPKLGPLALTSINQSVWNSYRDQMFAEKDYKRNTIHQHKMAIRVVLKQATARGELPSVPPFLNDTANKRQETPQTWFSPAEYRQLVQALRKNIKQHSKTRWHDAALELRDYVLFVTNSGLRPGEAQNVRFSDVEIKKDRDKKAKEYLLIRNIKGKRGTGTCRTFYGAVKPFLRRIEARNLQNDWKASQELLFSEYHRDMFNELLERHGLRYTKDRPPLRRNLWSLRHTYICFRLLAGTPIFAIANNCRTSVSMIEQRYARYLSPEQNDSINTVRVFDVDEED